MIQMSKIGGMAKVTLGVQTLVKARNVDPTPRLWAEDNPHFRTVLLAIRPLNPMEGFLQFISCKICPDLYVISIQVTLTVRVAETARWMYQK